MPKRTQLWLAGGAIALFLVLGLTVPIPDSPAPPPPAPVATYPTYSSYPTYVPLTSTPYTTEPYTPPPVTSTSGGGNGVNIPNPDLPGHGPHAPRVCVGHHPRICT